MKIICDSHIPFLNGVLEPYADVVYLPGNAITRDDVLDADALIVRTRTRCDARLLEGTKVRFIATATIGFDHIDTVWCQSNGITWTNAPGCNSLSVQQYMGSLLVGMARHFNFECREKTLGVVGVGNVGGKVARLAALLGFRVLLCDPPRARREGTGGFVTLDEIIERSDIITCHVPLTFEGQDSTYHLFDDSRLARMSSSQILINTSRGEVVDGKALKQVLQNRSIKAASLDVWENEPDIDPELLGLLFSGTPHIAGYSLDGKATGTAMCVQALGQFFDLPCGNWEVNDIPAPDQPLEFSVDASVKKPQEVLGDAILHTYNIMDDCSRLKADISGFERQRSEHPVRREFQAFTVNPIDDTSGRATVFLREAGFNISE
ncbi:MAG: 4-phosphoerythronate dehydrogenase [Bacteroidaceae bacterium]|nr:4-phosphoerythronate dehydrogenase [Bacteroidaceae bacterium]